MKIDWTGIFPAVTTKFTVNDEIDYAAFDYNIKAQLDAGIDGIILGGSLGEASTLTEQEKLDLLSHTLKLVDGAVPVLMNVTEQATSVAVSFAQKAEKLGADGLMLLPPMRYKADDEETLAFFISVAKGTSLPIMIYNNPVDYKIEVTPDMFEKMLPYENIQAVKDSSRDVSNITRMISRFGDRYKILTGVDPLALECLLMGACGWVAGLVNAFPKETVAVYRLAKAGRLEEALAIYRWFLPVLELDIHPKLVQYIKLAEVVTGLGTENVRAPRLAIKGEEREKVLRVVGEALASYPGLPEGSWGMSKVLEV
ncbi:dihydrodipicolinate synthase family protein [Hufsiella ginkgonis]|uniref:Dihydrodipicolinate synthase family protein n=1 Tax=Hufsiella ginkgonis TaxID=2695274 RepID=A0A7K1Y3K4_9SPHI|nr:dihydrodipicolinate synthase family protein [Hufsiella ginkgonis]MXV17266.1 dihydrodipicolinate synthase family protein [Hufsiella ginkgonis]